MTSVLDQVLAAENLHDLTPQALEVRGKFEVAGKAELESNHYLSASLPGTIRSSKSICMPYSVVNIHATLGARLNFLSESVQSGVPA